MLESLSSSRRSEANWQSTAPPCRAKDPARVVAYAFPRLLGRTPDSDSDTGTLTMPLSIKVQSVAHNALRTIGDDAQGTFMALCRASVGGSCTLGFVAPFSDTMFNTFQLKQFLVDLDEAAERAGLSDDQHALVQAIRDAAQEAIQKSGYLLIVGD